ncbi:MAG TPA: tRNA (adenosine(37)-N6)-threonylcarbamoyltransferase complex ATPase subunit type 1 TsaE [Catalimonadaceae bacterium]|nr:tRNA (adenosine(37)-N6)-threonylcarbamoyltransferase complex ATPase subunit type 1 TsaE [Catalimonadaceae bacterium]
MTFPYKITDTEFAVDYRLYEAGYVASILYQLFGKHKIWLLEGELGAGKTTLVKLLKQPLYIDDEILSPTFSLVNEYKSTTLKKVYHLDLYRLKSIEEADEIGLFEIIDSGYFCLIEWASAIHFEPGQPHLKIQIEHLNEHSRRLTAILHEN